MFTTDFKKLKLFHIYSIFNKSIKLCGVYNLEIFIQTTSKFILPILFFFKNSTLTQFKSLIEIVVYDEPTKNYRFTVVYSLLSIQYNTRLQVSFKTSEFLPVFSVTNLYQSAYWSEREIWDLYGIFFLNHNDLRRILTDYNFSGHPLRKDFPLSGYADLFYDDKKKRLVYLPIEITQEYRSFNFVSPWK